MTRLVSRAESWEAAYEAFKNVNFAAFDYDTVKQSMLEYIKLYFPETFNDYIESSEFIAIVEVFAYLAEITAYRLDVNAHENFLPTAQRKDSVLRLAQFVSYTASRNLPARGLVKITSVRTTERVLDANGLDLSNRTIIWNDNNNPNWKNQFLQIMDRVMEQPFGTVSPNTRFQIENVLFEIYSWNNNPTPNGVISYNVTTSDGTSVPMELVPVDYDTEAQTIIEKRPERDSKFYFLYGSDGLGDASNYTGFFCYTKQGVLQRISAVFDGVTPNQFFNVPALNVNETDVWLNNVNAETGEIIVSTDPVFTRPAPAQRVGEWQAVDTARSENVIFNTNKETRNKYQIETLSGDAIRLIFGDGEFSNIPDGAFDIWYRLSANQDIVINQSAGVNVTGSFTYLDVFNRVQTFTFTFTLVNSLLNASSSETIEHIRSTAPSVYATQDRMVNSKDYNTYMLQDPSILKLRAFNRTFAGDSRYIQWRDPSGEYENVKIFGDDLIIYTQTQEITFTANTDSFEILITSYIQPLLSSPDVFLFLVSQGVPTSQIRRVFTQAERDRITAALTPPPSPTAINLFFDKTTYEWYALKASATPSDPGTPPYYTDGLGNVGWPTNFIDVPVITVTQTSIFENEYEIGRLSTKIIAESDTTAFWNLNQGDRVINYDTLNSNFDTITILKANVNADRSGILSKNYPFNILSQELVESGLPDAGLPDIHRVSILPLDENQDRIPDNIDLDDLLNPKLLCQTAPYVGQYEVTITLAPSANTTLAYTLPNGLYGLVDVTASLGTTDLRVTVTPDTPDLFINPTLYDDGLESYPLPTLTSGRMFNSFELELVNGNAVTPITFTITVDFIEHVYFNRFSVNDPWQYVPATYNNLDDFVEYNITRAAEIAACVVNTGQTTEQCATQFPPLWKREQGRAGFNFAWYHNTPYYYLTDPAPTNIIDMFIITKGYYDSVVRWLQDPSLPVPMKPTPVDLRTSYTYLLDNKMISDTVVMHPGNLKLLFGSRSIPELRATFKVIKNENSVMTDNQIKTNIVSIVRNFFDIQYWNFGESFYFTELAAAIHQQLPNEIKSIVIVPTFTQNQFGDMFEIRAREDEILVPDIQPGDIEIVISYNDVNLRLNG